MNKDPEAQRPARKQPWEHDKGLRRDAADEVGRVVREASEAETNGQFALASLLALHALQLDPTRAEASAIFERSQAALGRKKDEIETPDLPLARIAPEAHRERFHAGSPEPPENRSIETLFRDDALRHPIDLDGVLPLTPGPTPRGFGSRVFRAVLPFLVLGLLMAGIWLTSTRTGPAPVAARPAVAEPEPETNAEAVAERPGAVAPGTVALNVVPWARVDAIYSVHEGHQIEPSGLVSPCTVSLPPGTYSFTVSHPDFGSTNLPVVVKSGEVTKVEHSLISNQDLEKELAPALKSAVYPSSRADQSKSQRSAALRR